MNKKYQIILCDPPWSYEDKMNNDPKYGGITYPVMTHEQIRNLPVSLVADKNCALFMWVTMPMLEKAFDIINAWGFKYRTVAFTWVKQNPKGDGIYSGLGHWTNANAELCLFAKRGAPKRVAKNVKQIIMAPRSRHSAKPPETKDRIIQLMGDLPRLEMFARERSHGFDVWGNEVESDVDFNKLLPF